MKKFTSLFCALMILMSASAMGVDARTIEKKHRQQVMREAMIRNNGQLPIQVKAPQLKAETINLTISDKPYVSSNDWGGNQQVYISMQADEGYSITIYINGILEMVNGQTYTVADMDDWSSIYNSNTYQSSGLSAASLTWSQDAEGLQRFEGFVSDTLGNTYNFLYQEVPFAPTGDTILVRFSKIGSFDYYTWNGYWSVSGYDIYGSSNPYSVYFSLNTGSDSIVAGHYTEADFVAEGSNNINISRSGMSSKSYNWLTADITIVERNDSLLLNAYAMAEDGNVYDIYIYYADPKPIYHRNITASMTVDTTGLNWGMVGFKGANAEFEVSISAYIPSSAEDYHVMYDYKEGDFYPSLYNLTDSTYISVFSGTITVTKGANGDILTGTLLGWDDTEYEIYMTEGTPEKTREETISMDNAGLYIYEDLHKFIIWGCSEDSSRVVAISILSDTISGNYTFEDVELSNSYIAYDMNEMGYIKDKFTILDATISVAYDNETGEAVLTGSILAQSDYHVSDVPEFTLLIKAQPAHPHLDFDTEDADFEAVYNDYEVTYDNGFVVVEAANETSVAALAFIVAEGDTAFTTGTYTCSMKGEPMTVLTGSCDGQKVYVSFFGKFNAQGFLTDLWFPYAGEVTVSEDGVIVFDALNSYDRTIKVTLNPKKSEGVENIAEKASNAAKRIENNMLIIEKNGVKYSVIGNVIK